MCDLISDVSIAVFEAAIMVKINASDKIIFEDQKKE